MFTSYQETIGYLFGCLPVFQHSGPGAYKPGLDTARKLDEAFGSPSRRLKTIHIAGTNGKGSTAHTIAAILQSAGYKVGLYTSPHLTDFRERIRINGAKIPRENVVDFTNRYIAMRLDCSPTFFELTTIMAFEYFRDSNVDVAVIETGLGGRLDTTNIITPLLSVITNISLDHTSLLGSTPAEIAREKAGIIKPGVPVVIGEADDPDVREVFISKAKSLNSPILFAASVDHARTPDGITYSSLYGTFTGELTGDYQIRNTATVLAALSVLSRFFTITPATVAEGFGRVTCMTGLMGRWMKIADSPLTVCDTGHNPGGWQYITRQLADYPHHVQLIIGFVADKDISSILHMISRLKNASLYFTAPDVPRRLPAERLASEATKFGLTGQTFPTLADAMMAARRQAGKDDMIFIGGSNFLVAPLFSD